MSTPFTGEIRLVAFNFAPQGWAKCEGQLLQVSQNGVLFSILGNQYGGDGENTFALPDLRGRAALAQGQGNGLTARSLAEKGGSEVVTLTKPQLPEHLHTLSASTAPASTTDPNDAVPAKGGSYKPMQDAGTIMDSDSLTEKGGNQPHSNVQPQLAVTYIIALDGVTPF
jgi:microcystin-dependent protein